MDQEQVTGCIQSTGVTREEKPCEVPRGLTNVYPGIFMDGNASAISRNVDQSTHYHFQNAERASLRHAAIGNRPLQHGKYPYPGLVRAELHDAHAKLMQSLSFEGIWQRHENIVAAYPGTCKWILSEQDEAALGQQSSHLADKHRFCKWLETDEDLYWIQGSAGSGKSTLVSFVDRT